MCALLDRIAASNHENKRRDMSRKTLKRGAFSDRVRFHLVSAWRRKEEANLNTAGGYRGQTQPTLIAKKLKQPKEVNQELTRTFSGMAIFG